MSSRILFQTDAELRHLEPANRNQTLSSRIVAQVREALFEGRLRPGDTLGTEKEIAAGAGVSRIAARDALRTLEALGIVEIRVGAGGGARIAAGNPVLFAEAFAVQLALAGAEVREIMDAQRAVEAVAAEQAAETATPEDLARLRGLLAEAEAKLGDMDAFTRSSFGFHMAVAEAAHNRVLVIQLASLQHVAWPIRNRTLTAAVARHILDVHRELADLIEARDAAAARRVMDEHVRMIRARRVSESERDADPPPDGPCC